MTVMANSVSNMVGIILKNEWTRGKDWEPGEFLFSIILIYFFFCYVEIDFVKLRLYLKVEYLFDFVNYFINFFAFKASQF